MSTLPGFEITAERDEYFAGFSRGASLMQRMMFVLLLLTALGGLNSEHCPASELLSHAESWPPMPQTDGSVDIPAQEWNLRPGPRTVRILIHYPDGNLASVNSETGIMLTLHNWGGTDCVGTASPTELARRFNVIAVCVNYLQSGPKDSIEGPEPYDFGYLQALDALRSLWFVRDQLTRSNRVWDDGRLYCTGGSGGGNVTLMANKLAPCTFACVIDMCGMKKLSDDIAFNLPGGSELDARWSRDRDSQNFLRNADQELRFLGHPQHLKEMLRLGASARIVTVHGVSDTTCPFRDAQDFQQAVLKAGLPVHHHWIDSDRLDGRVFTSAGHSLGDRTAIVTEVACRYLTPGSQMMLRRTTPADFDRKHVIRYSCSDGTYLISYENGYPTGRFEPHSPPPVYEDHHNVLWLRGGTDTLQPVRTTTDWELRRQHIPASLQQVMGTLPGEQHRVPLEPVVHEADVIQPRAESGGEVRSIRRLKISFQSGETWRVPAWLLIPSNETELNRSELRRPAVLCLQQTTAVGKDEPAGMAGDPGLQYGLELAELGFVTLCPDYPSFGEYDCDLTERSAFESGSMRAVWDNIRAVDYLQSLPEVDPDRISCIGHSLGGHNAIFTAVFEPRLQVIVSSCGFTSLAEDDLPSWTGPRYMPLIAARCENDIRKLPFDFHELVAAIAPRPFMAFAAEQDDDFKVSGVRHVIESASTVYSLYGCPDRLRAIYAPVPHSFPDDARRAAYEFILQAGNTKPD